MSMFSKSPLERGSLPPERSKGDCAVLYLHPAKQGVDFIYNQTLGRPYGLMPVGLPAIINILRDNHISVKGLNYQLERQFNPDFNLKSWLQSRRGVRIILIDLHWYEHSYGTMELARVCKEILPWAKTIIGGLTASIFAKEILETHPQIDYVVRGDAEIPVLRLIHLLLSGGKPKKDELTAIPNLSFRIDGQVIENELGYTAATEDLDTLDFVSLDFLEHHNEYLIHEYIVTDIGKARQVLNSSQPFLGRWLCNARGCKYECAYCGGCKSAHKKIAGRNGIVIRSPQQMVLDLKKLESLGIHQASFSYDLAELGKEYWQVFLDGFQQAEIHIGIYNEFFQNPSLEFIDRLAQSADMEHTCVALSPLSGNERVRRINGKHFSNNQLLDTLDRLRKHNFNIFVYFSLNLPGETENTFSETLDLARLVFDSYPSHLLKILNTNHTVDPLSPMNERSEKYGVEATFKTFQDYYDYCRSTGIQSQDARTELHRGFHLSDTEARKLVRMADAWDQARQGRESSWWPVPPSW
jgi:hypothetical protein